MKRRLILIANDGGEEDKLPGVSIDMKNYQEFLARPEGGAWGNDEIQPMIDFSSAIALHDYIMTAIAMQDVKYFLIVFCGHGYVNPNNDTVLCMKDGSEVCVSDLKTWVQYTPCTLIADCCREKETIDNAQELLRESLFSETAMQLDAESCKRVYNRVLGLLPSGTFYDVYSARIGECAGDTDMLGGVYSYNLLKCADEAKRRLVAGYLQNGDTVGSLAQVHDAASPRVAQMRRGKQHPCRSEYTDRIPFVVIA